MTALGTHLECRRSTGSLADIGSYSPQKYLERVPVSGSRLSHHDLRVWLDQDFTLIGLHMNFAFPFGDYGACKRR
jgi:hypothetical protein